MIGQVQKPLEEILEYLEGKKKIVIVGYGECELGKFTSICPLTQCAKGLLNGPCGGSQDGKCLDKKRHKGEKFIEGSGIYKV
ncbi:unnamed protein product [marine sediment metagenome]|uniref:Methylene-tetrahydrofolate reductase C-terminal-like domain-containing protein n=1 Tax=marine sediment metagenome TaxID=412755 RepID=X1BNA0_9ZZZZ